MIWNLSLHAMSVFDMDHFGVGSFSLITLWTFGHTDLCDSNVVTTERKQCCTQAYFKHTQCSQRIKAVHTYGSIKNDIKMLWHNQGVQNMQCLVDYGNVWYTCTYTDHWSNSNIIASETTLILKCTVYEYKENLSHLCSTVDFTIIWKA